MTVTKRIDMECDRCGVELSGQPPKPWADCGEIKARGGDARLVVGQWGPGPGNYADLCPDCWTSFKDWWLAGRVK